MYVLGTSYVRELADGVRTSAKMIFNAKGAIVFPATEQHRDQKASGISYEDDYAGNALAAMLGSGHVEVRFHRSFSDAQVHNILRSLTEHPDLQVIRAWRTTYPGRELPQLG